MGKGKKEEKKLSICDFLNGSHGERLYDPVSQPFFTAVEKNEPVFHDLVSRKSLKSQ